MSSSKGLAEKIKAGRLQLWTSLGSYIKQRRTQLGLSQIELAHKIGFSAQFLGRIESGKCPLPEEAFLRIISTLGLDSKKVNRIYGDSSRNFVSTLFAFSSGKGTHSKPAKRTR